MKETHQHQSSSDAREKKRRSRNGLFLLWLTGLLFLLPASAYGEWDGVVIGEVDYQGLLAFKHDLYDPRGYLRSWNSTGLDACSGAWVGIKCVKGKVIAIQLPWRGLGGQITEKIGQLSALRKISLHDNFIGGQIPAGLGFLTDLRGLYLFNNRFSGEIPPAIGNCSLIQTIDASNNFLTGSIPPIISNLGKLYRLNLANNSLSGEIPDAVAGFTSLTFLSLRYNNLSGTIPDSWGGVAEANSVYQLQSLNLDHNSLLGNIPSTLGRLQKLQEISLNNNMLNGSIPDELGTLPLLRTLDLSHNFLGGGFPASLGNLSSLTLLDLSRNILVDNIPGNIDGLKRLSVFSMKGNLISGEIPSAMGNITSLSELDLSDNELTGEIPASLNQLVNLTFFNVSDNNLSGQVPLILVQRFNASSFTGNIQLCGFSTSVPCPSPPQPPPPNLQPSPSPPEEHQRRKRLSTRSVIFIVVGAILAMILLLLCCLFLCCFIRKRKALGTKTSGQEACAGATVERGEKPRAAPSAAEAESGADAGGKLVHFDGPLAFTADDLLCATAEIMGKSTYGTVYKATLEDGNQVAVKRLREKIAKGQKDFEAEVNVLGKIRHPNLLALRAYYLGPKAEKLLVFDYMPKGSLAAFLHARGPDTPVDWTARMKIAMGVARGLRYIHAELNMVHGNLTSSNILLDDGANARISDYGLSKLMTAAGNSNVIATSGALGYRAPELSKLKKANTKTDVYSLGVVMLELLTGKSPGEAMNGVDLPQWVASIVKEEWTNEVFDLELMRDVAGNAGDELLNTLKLALHCVDPSPAERPEVDQVLRQLEEIRPDLAGDEAARGALE